MKKILNIGITRAGTIALFLFIISCSPFSKFSKSNVFLNEKCPSSNTNFPIVSNPDLGISTITFGDFKFASSKKEFKTINPSKNPEFKDILFYGLTDDYDYYLLLNLNKQLPENYISNDTIIGGNKYILVASKSIHKSDFDYLKTHLYSIETNLTDQACF